MSNVHRWRWGDMNPIVVAVDATTVIEIGDALWLDTDDAKPAASLADAGTTAMTQEAFHDVFLGIALQQHRSTDPAGDIAIGTTGIFEFISVSATYQPGTRVGMHTPVADGILTNQTVVTVATDPLSIGRVVRLATTATRVFVAITSTVIYGGPQVMA